MQITENFTLSELCHSNTAKKNGIDNVAPPEAIQCLTTLCKRVLQPLRDAWGHPLVINSGYRCEKVNKMVGGVANSQHLTGKAVDIATSEPRKLLATLLSLGIEYDQAIVYANFLHVSYNSGRNRKQVLYAKGIKP